MEHAKNFEGMVTKLMTAETVIKLSKNASVMTMTFNHKIEWIPLDYNMNQIHKAYGMPVLLFFYSYFIALQPYFVLYLEDIKFNLAIILLQSHFGYYT